MAYDGVDDGIFNWSDQVLVLHDLAYHCLATIGEAGSPYDEQHRIMLSNYKGNNAACYSRDTHRYARMQRGQGNQLFNQLCKCLLCATLLVACRLLAPRWE